MPKLAKPLSVKEVEQRAKTDGRHTVGGVPGLCLLVAGNGRSWILWAQIGKRRTLLGLGPYPEVSLAEAREKATAIRKQIREGVDPVAEKRKDAVERKKLKKKAVTFGECAEVTIGKKTAGLTNEKHKAQWRSTLETYCKPIWSRPVFEIDKHDIIEILDPIWTTKNETASRLRGRIEAVMAYAKGKEYRTGDNPAGWELLEPLLPEYRPEVEQQAALDHKQIGAFMVDLRKRNSVSAKALEFLILTATRTKEVIGAKWNEIDLEAREWTIPKERMKKKKEHIVPLSETAVALLKALPRIVGNPYVFVGGSKDGCLSNMALLQLVRGMNEKEVKYADWRTGKPIVPHGFRSTFRDWAGDDSEHEREVIEHALAHRLPDAAEAAYWRRTSLPKRVKLIQEWADYCAKPGDNVASIKRAANA